jgi:hypothetical protein
MKGTKIVLFADVTNILLTAEKRQILQQRINRFIHDLCSWFCANNLILNTEKTTAILLHASQEKKPIEISRQI